MKNWAAFIAMTILVMMSTMVITGCGDSQNRIGTAEYNGGLTVIIVLTALCLATLAIDRNHLTMTMFFIYLIISAVIGLLVYYIVPARALTALEATGAFSYTIILL